VSLHGFLTGNSTDLHFGAREVLQLELPAPPAVLFLVVFAPGCVCMHACTAAAAQDRLEGGTVLERDTPLEVCKAALNIF
jgi:hypothetical protein